MTLYLAFEALANGRLKLTDPIVVSPHAARMAPSHLGLRAGESISVDDAIRAITVKSANDMAVALAERVGGSESRFATLMTLRAQELGMTNTHYVNASGLPDARQITTARDIATLSRAVMRDFPQYYSYFSLHEFTYRGEVMTKHGLLGKLDGLKTGFTNASGFNLAATAAVNNNRLIAVMLGGNSAAARDRHVQALLDSGFEALRRRQLGELVDVAQLMQEPDPVGPITQSLTGQGSEEQTGSRIVLNADPSVAKPGGEPGGSTDAADARPTYKLMTARPDSYAAADNSRSFASKPSRGVFLVQVGTFRRKSDAHDQLNRVSRRLSGKLGEAKSEVTDRDHGRYHARFVGLSKAEASMACKALTAHRQVCKVMSTG
jgi:D-alanyl-D-alanine carboxypeptidase (penicillin-binding protein 5/6)